MTLTGIPITVDSQVPRPQSGDPLCPDRAELRPVGTQSTTNNFGRRRGTHRSTEMEGPGADFGSLGWSRRRLDAAGRATSPARTRQL